MSPRDRSMAGFIWFRRSGAGAARGSQRVVRRFSPLTQPWSPALTRRLQMLCHSLENLTTRRENRGNVAGPQHCALHVESMADCNDSSKYLILRTCVLLEYMVLYQRERGQHRRLRVIDDEASATTGALLRWERVRAGFTQKQLADKAELDEVTVNHVENDKRRRPHPRTIHKLADALGIPVERLLPPSPPSRGYS